MVDGNYYSELIYNAKTPADALKVLDSLMQIEINQINQLPGIIDFENPNAEKKENEIQDFLINEVHAFYGAVFLNGIFLKRRSHVKELIKDPQADPNLYNHDWELLVEKLNEQAKSALNPTPNSPDYIEFMESMASTLANYKQYAPPSQNPTIESLDEIVINRLFNYDTTLFYDKKSRLAYELSGLQFFLNDQLFNSPTLLHAVCDLQTKYKTSAHLGIYKEKIEKLRANLEVAKRDFSGAKIIHTNCQSFDQLLKRFEGKNVLIDVWATWCHPCVDEFKHKAIIQPFVESSKIEVIYISIDKREWEERWKQSIKINELHGNHFRADREFIDDMWHVIGGNAGHAGAIPRFVLVGKDGRIFKSEAARPSGGSELVQQIELLINQGVNPTTAD